MTFLSFILKETFSARKRAAVPGLFCVNSELIAFLWLIKSLPSVDFYIFVLIRQRHWVTFFSPFSSTDDTKHTLFLVWSCFVVSSHVTYGGSNAAQRHSDPRRSGSGVRGSVDGAQLWLCDDEDDDWLTGTVWGRGWLTLRLCPHQNLGGRLLWMLGCFCGWRK